MVISLQQLKQNCTPQAIKFENSFAKFKKHFTHIQHQLYPESLAFYQSYIAKGEKLIFQGDHNRDLSKVDWMNHNFRYGSFSIDGTLGEMLALWMWNTNVFSTTAHVGPETKEAQRSGVDLVLRNPDWTKEINVQVKLSKISSWVSLPADLEKYNPKIVHRVMLIDPSNMKLITADLSHLARLYYDDDIMHRNGKAFVKLSSIQKIPNVTLFISTQNNRL